ncbi:MAG: EAL domain-containing protein [Firmicutes bacterium]|nr:EAL domain-containing protein [Bacillota bacterium]
MNREKIKAFFDSVINQNAVASEDTTGIEFWSNKIFSLLSFFLIFLGGPILLYGSYLFYTDGYVILAMVEAMVFLVIVFAIYNKKLRTDTRKFLIILSIYVISIVLLVYTGPYGAGMISVVFSFVLSVALLNKKRNRIFFTINLNVFVILTVLLYLDVFNGLAIEVFNNYWLVNAFTAQIVILVLSYLFTMIFDGLESQTQKIIESKTLIAEREEKYRLLADTTADVIWVYNVSTGKFVYISPSIEDLRGFTVEEAMAQHFVDKLAFDSGHHFMEEISRTTQEFIAEPDNPKRYIYEVQQPCKNGEIIWVETSSRYRYNGLGEIEIVSSSRNINERKLKEEEIRYIDFHDPLTGLLNRKALSKSFADVKAKKGKKSVILVNIDNFRVINDALGHHEGDQVLLEMASKILKCVGISGLVYRYGGDEYVIIVESHDWQFVEQLASQVFKSISTQFMVARRLFYLTASIGISFGSETEGLEQTVKNADTALYAAKKERNKIVVYVPEMDQTRTREAILEKDMKVALEKGEFELHFQPIYDINKGVFNHAEALLRWNHPYLGRISPADFIPIAEKSKLIIPITDWVIREACQAVRNWQEMGITEMTVSINISLLSFENRGTELVESVASGIYQAGIKPAFVKLEITESILIRDTEEIVKVFYELKQMGVKLALDDFGTGYSSFGCMKDLPLDIIKLDRSLISNMVTDEREQMIAESMITIIHGLGIQVVAEGVETEEQLEFLKKFGCDFIQGYLFSRPLTTVAFIDYCFSKMEPG